jgi:hypothetical protein
MNNQQHANKQNEMPSSIIQFEIQTLEGELLSVGIQKSEAEKVYTGNDAEWTNPNPYDSYGLDFLKTAISEQNGIDTITMQLFTAQGELTTATPLLPLQNQVFSLMIKSPITITFQNPQTPPTNGSSGQVYALERHIDFLKGTEAHTSPTVCYIHTQDPRTIRPMGELSFRSSTYRSPELTPPPAIKIQAVGLERDFFKISINNLPFHLLRDSNWTYAEKFVLRPQMAMPMHLWLRLDKNTMTLD